MSTNPFEGDNEPSSAAAELNAEVSENQVEQVITRELAEEIATSGPPYADESIEPEADAVPAEDSPQSAEEDAIAAEVPEVAKVPEVAEVVEVSEVDAEVVPVPAAQEPVPTEDAAEEEVVTVQEVVQAAEQQQEEPEEQKEQINDTAMPNGDAIASFVGTDSEEGVQAAEETNGVSQEQMAELIVERDLQSTDEPVEHAEHTNGTSVPADFPVLDDAPDGSDDGSAEKVSARIKMLSTVFSKEPPTDSSNTSIKGSVPVGRVKHSVNGSGNSDVHSSGRLSISGDRSQPIVPVEVTENDKINTANVFKMIEAAEFAKKPLVDFIPYEELVRLRLEDGIDATRKEEYLTEEDFLEVFGFSRVEYIAMPRWKQIEAKKMVHLY